MLQWSTDKVCLDADINGSNVNQEEKLGQEGPKTKPRKGLVIEQSRRQEVGLTEKSVDAAIPANACLDQRSRDPVTDWRTMVNFTILIAAMMMPLASAPGEL
jgi:hypothetical protein